MSGDAVVDARGNKDRPFGCPAEIELDLPAPPSINKTRKIDRATIAEYFEWRRLCDQHVMYQRKRCKKIAGPYEVQIVLSDKSRLDLDNVIKQVVDYLVNIEMVQGDSKSFLRKLSIAWGDAPEGVHVKVWALPS